MNENSKILDGQVVSNVSILQIPSLERLTQNWQKISGYYKKKLRRTPET